MKNVRKLINYKPAGRLSFTFESKVDFFDGQAVWYYCDLPQDLSVEIDRLFADQKRGFGSLPVIAELVGYAWQTSIFPNSESKTFMLPLKVQARKHAKIEAGDKVRITVIINV